MNPKCFFCYHRTIEKQLTKHAANNQQQANVILKECAELINNNWMLSPPELCTLSTNIFKNHLHINDLYKEEKDKANKLLLNNYELWKRIVNKADNPVFTALKMTVIGNIIDYGSHHVPDDLEAEILRLLQVKITIDQSKILLERLQSANSILYLGDNAGEIVFDKLFLETAKLNNVTYVVRNNPILNDITIDDTAYTGIDKIVKVIKNGYDGPSTVVNKCSQELQQLFSDADVVISKGQGNFEGLCDETRKNLFFLLMAKCDVIADIFKVKVGDLIITENNS